MEAGVERLEAAVGKLEDTLDKANSSEEKLMCQYDTMSQLFFEKEKVYLSRMDEMEKRHAEEKAAMREAEAGRQKRDHKIILVLAVTLLFVLTTVIGGLFYFISNYDVTFDTYQSVSAEGGGNATIEDGIRYNANSVDDTNAG